MCFSNYYRRYRSSIDIIPRPLIVYVLKRIHDSMFFRKEICIFILLLAPPTDAISVHRFRVVWKTHWFFCKFRNVIESPKPVNASSAMYDMLLPFRSKCLSRCRRRSDSLGIECKLLSPSLRYWRFSATKQNKITHVFSLNTRRPCNSIGDSIRTRTPIINEILNV